MAELCRECKREGRDQVAHRSNPPLCRWHFYRAHPQFAPEELPAARWEALATPETEKEKVDMPRHAGIDLEAAKCDIAAGMKLSAIAEKQGVAKATLYRRLALSGISYRALRRNASPNLTTKLTRNRHTTAPTAEDLARAAPGHIAPAAESNGHARARFMYVEVEGSAVTEAILALHKVLEAKL